MSYGRHSRAIKKRHNFVREKAGSLLLLVNNYTISPPELGFVRRIYVMMGGFGLLFVMRKVRTHSGSNGGRD